MVGMIVLIFSIMFQIFAFLNVPFFTTIHAYTIGMIFGYYNPLFYLFVVYVGLQMLLGPKVKLPSWIKLTPVTYWIVAILIVFIAASTGYYQSKSKWTEIGPKAWSAMDEWFTEFKGSSWVSPENTNGGCIGAILYCFFTMIASGIGSFIIAIVGLVVAISYIITGSSIGFYRNLLRKRRELLHAAEVAEKEKTVDLTLIPTKKSTDKQKQATQTQEISSLKESEANNQTSDDDFPFEDPFSI